MNQRSAPRGCLPGHRGADKVFQGSVGRLVPSPREQDLPPSGRGIEPPGEAIADIAHAVAVAGDVDGIHLGASGRIDEVFALLVEHFLAGAPIGPEGMELLRRYDWPGNVRELQNQLLSARALAGDDPLGPLHLWPHLQEERPEEAPEEALLKPGLTLRQARERFERRFIQARLEEHGGNLAAAARDLGMSRSRLYQLVEQYGLRGGRTG